jgi:hypothetical protein
MFWGCDPILQGSIAPRGGMWHKESLDNAVTSPLEVAFQYFLEHQDELVAEHNGKFVVIKGRKVVGVYADELHAVTETQKVHAVGTFLVQKVEPGTAAYTQTFHSRAAFCDRQTEGADF